jgi:hypothetical protein
MALMPLTHSDELLPEDDRIYDRVYFHFVNKHPGQPKGNFVSRMRDGDRWGVFYRDAQGNVEEPPPGYVLDTRREAQGLAGLLNVNERIFGRAPSEEDGT